MVQVARAICWLVGRCPLTMTGAGGGATTLPPPPTTDQQPRQDSRYQPKQCPGTVPVIFPHSREPPKDFFFAGGQDGFSIKAFATCAQTRKVEGILENSPNGPSPPLRLKALLYPALLSFDLPENLYYCSDTANWTPS